MSARFDIVPEVGGDAAYAAACGRIRALEKRLLGPAQLEELLGARSLASLVQSLERLGAIAGPVSDPETEWEAALERAGTRADRVLLDLDPNPLVSRTLVLRADLANVRSLLRAQALGVAYDGPWNARALFARPALEAMLRVGDDTAWPGPLARRLAALRRDPPGDLQGVNGALDAAWIGALREGATLCASRLFLDWLGHAADLGNVGARLRLAAAPSAWRSPPVVIPGGHLDVHLLAEGSAPALLGRLSRTVYAPVAAAAADGRGGVSLALFERASDDFLTALLRPARYLSLGPEPLWAWHLGLEIDAKNVRTLVLGRLAGIPAERLGTMLRRPHAA